MTERVSGGSSVLRVLIEPRSSDPNIWVAQCLETGFITTGVGYNEAREGILEVLRTEVMYAQENEKTLTRQTPIPTDLEERWESVTRECPPQTVQLFPAEKKRPGRVGNIREVEVTKFVG